MQRDVKAVLLAIIASLLLIRYALPQEATLDHLQAWTKACREHKPLIVYVNTKAVPVPGCVVCRVDHLSRLDMNVGVAIGAPTSWEGLQGNVEQRHVGTIYGPASPERILAIVNAYRVQCSILSMHC